MPTKTRSNGTVTLHDQALSQWWTVKDNYLAEVLSVDDSTESGIVLVRGKTDREGRFDQSAEEWERGWVAAEIVAVGGFFPDDAPIPAEMRKNYAKSMPYKFAHRFEKDDWVPMWYKPGQRCMIDRADGRYVILGAKRYVCISQATGVIGALGEPE